MAEAGILRGLKVLEITHFIAGPFCARVLADLGAEVIKVEPPEKGDPLRDWGLKQDGQSVWWSVASRNKKCVTLNMKSPQARPILEKLIAWADVLVENFRPGQLEKWGLGWDVIQRLNPRCIVARISGFGQDGPYRDKVAFGAIGEAMGGIRYLTGHPPEVSDLPPVRTGIALADDIASIYAVSGILAAVYERDVIGTGKGRVVDVALYEGVFSFMEGALPEYGKFGHIRRPEGASMPTTAPSNAYRTRDAQWLIVAGNSDLITQRLLRLIGHGELANEPRFKTNADRVKHRAELDRLIGAWVATQDIAAAEQALGQSDVPVGRVYTIKDCAEDPHYQARGMIQEVADPRLGPVLHPGPVPRFDASGPGTRIAWAGPALGQHNAEVYGAIAGLGADDLGRLRAGGVV